MTSLAAFDAFCQGLPGANFIVQWGESHVHKVGPKLFAIGNLSDEGFVFKATPLGFTMLLEQGLAERAPYLTPGALGACGAAGAEAGGIVCIFAGVAPFGGGVADARGAAGAGA